MKAHIDVKEDKITITTDNATFTISDAGIDIKAKGEVKVNSEKVVLDEPQPLRNALQRLPLPSRVKKVLS